MKRNYVKPIVVFDNFELTANIAMCELTATVVKRYECGILDNELGMTIFMAGCDIEPADGDNICYEIPLEDYNVFNS